MGAPNPGTCLSASFPCTTNDQGTGSQDHFRMQGQKDKRRPRKDKRLLPESDSSHSEHTDPVLVNRMAPHQRAKEGLHKW